MIIDRQKLKDDGIVIQRVLSVYGVYGVEGDGRQVSRTHFCDQLFATEEQAQQWIEENRSTTSGPYFVRELKVQL